MLGTFADYLNETELLKKNKKNKNQKVVRTVLLLFWNSTVKG